MIRARSFFRIARGPTARIGGRGTFGIGIGSLCEAPPGAVKARWGTSSWAPGDPRAFFRDRTGGGPGLWQRSAGVLVFLGLDK